MNAATNPLNGLEKTLEWFKKAKPNPTNHDLQVQVGCHIEEFGEFLKELTIAEGDYQGQHLLGQTMLLIDALGDHFKNTKETILTVEPTVNVLDAICDNMVTGTGVAYMLGNDLMGALGEVNRSNFSKFDENGEPVIKPNGKIGKSWSYTKPALEPFLVVQQPVADAGGVTEEADQADEGNIEGAVAEAAEEEASDATA